MKPAGLVILIALAFVLWACANGDIVADEGQAAPHAGEAVNANIAAQIVNPEAPVAAPPQAMDGQRAALAQDRYAKGKVIEPKEVSTGTTVGRSSGGGGAQ